jgi:hypothetical protein
MNVNCAYGLLKILLAGNKFPDYANLWRIFVVL